MAPLKTKAQTRYPQRDAGTVVPAVAVVVVDDNTASRSVRGLGLQKNHMLETYALTLQTVEQHLEAAHRLVSLYKRKHLGVTFHKGPGGHQPSGNVFQRLSRRFPKKNHKHLRLQRIAPTANPRLGATTAEGPHKHTCSVPGLIHLCDQMHLRGTGIPGFPPSHPRNEQENHQTAPFLLREASKPNLKESRPSSRLKVLNWALLLKAPALFLQGPLRFRASSLEP